MDIQRGTQIIGVWGSMVSESHGFVSCIQDTNQGTEVDISWDNGSVHHVMLDDIQNDYLDQPYGNSNGFYINPFTEELI